MRYNNKIDDKILSAWNDALKWGMSPFGISRDGRKRLWHRIKDLLDHSDKSIGKAVWKFFRENYNKGFVINTNAISGIEQKFKAELKDI